jgi:superfamily I DNA/RNA helicase
MLLWIAIVMLGEEERCLFFVSVSRAKRRLILTHAQFRERPTGYKSTGATNVRSMLNLLPMLPAIRHRLSRSAMSHRLKVSVRLKHITDC